MQAGGLETQFGWRFAERSATATAGGGMMAHVPSLLAVVVGAAFLLPIGAFPLFDRREEHIAADAADTLDHGHWLVAFDHGRPRLKKPPLSRWVAAASVFVFGRTEFAVRLPFALASLAAMAMAATLASRIGGATAGIAAAFVFATNFLVVSESWVASAETLLTATTAASLLCFLRAEDESESDVGRNRWLTASGFALGLALLTKGPIAAVLFSFAAASFILLERPSARRSLCRGRFLIPAFGPPLVWAAAVIATHPEALGVWRHEIAHKVVGPDVRSMLLPKFFPMSAPWIAISAAGVFLPGCRWSRHRPGIWMAWGWCVGNLAMFSTWTGAREPYYLACMPAVAVLAGLAWSDANADRAPAWMSIVRRIQVGIVVGVLAAAPMIALRESPRLAPAAFSLAVVSIGFIFWNWNQLGPRGRVACLAFPIAVGALGAAPEVRARAATLSHQEFCRRTAEIVDRSALPLRFLADPGISETAYMDSPDVTESIWFYLSPPPAPVFGVDALARALYPAGDGFASTSTAMLLVLSPAQLRLLEKDGRFGTAIEVDESRFGRWDTQLVRVWLAPNRTPTSAAGPRANAVE